MRPFTSACAAGALLLASLAAAGASPDASRRTVPLPGTGGRWVYDGRLPPSCDIRNIRIRHFEGDGHRGGHEHLGHGHRWSKRNFKGYPTKPPCYVRRTGEGRESILFQNRRPRAAVLIPAASLLSKAGHLSGARS